MGARVGTLTLLRRYPVKSMRGEDLEAAFVGRSGVKGDRLFAFRDLGRKDDFPWLTARQVPEMILFEPKVLDEDPRQEAPPGRRRVQVTTPEGERYDLEDPAFLERLRERWKRPLELRFSAQGIPDVAPISILGLATVDRVQQETGATLDPRRFRANFYVEWDDPAPFFEETLLGRTFGIGPDLQVRLEGRDSRCVIVNLDPATARSGPDVLRTVTKLHGGCVGLYGRVGREGVAEVGGPVSLLD